ncbi:hypothetical protein GGX14DRAFT_554776 [Mycena pura]|nr:hypothetical protein GGX14DRAFT_554776 [Mycena pura]
MFSSSNSSPAPPILCPRCNKRYLNSPKRASGHFNAENEGRLFQTCPDNVFQTGKGCDGFIWLTQGLSAAEIQELSDSRLAHQLAATEPSPPSTPSFTATQRQQSQPCLDTASPPNNAPALSALSTPATPTPTSNGDFTIDVQDRAVTESYRMLSASKHKAYWFIADN